MDRLCSADRSALSTRQQRTRHRRIVVVRAKIEMDPIARRSRLVALNFFAFGPLGGLVMIAVELTAVVFVMLGLILCRHFASSDQR